MSKIFVLINVLVFMSFANKSAGQCDNLVPNGGFEENTALPNDDCSWALAAGWTNAAASSDCNSNNGTPDYFHLGGQGDLSALPVNYYSELQPFEGDAVMGIGGNLSFLDNAREYISIALSSPLVVGNTYTLSFSMTIGAPQVGGLYTDGWGVLLSTGIVLQPVGTNGLIAPTGNLFSIPEVFTSEEWQTFTFEFTADQPYTQLTFGNFLSDAQQNVVEYGFQDFVSLAYVFIDDFSITGGAINAPELELGVDFELCGLSSNLDATTEGALSYLWNTGVATSTISVTEPGLYYVDVEWSCGVVRDSVLVSPCPTLSVSLGPNIEICEGENITITATVVGGVEPYSYAWNQPVPNTSISVSPAFNATTLVSLVVTDGNGNTALDELTVEVNSNIAEINLGEDQTYCAGDTVLLDAESAFATSYNWNTGSTSSTLVVTAPGEYIITASSNCNTVSDTLNINNGEVTLPAFNLSEGICDDEELLIGPVAVENANLEWVDDADAGFPRTIDDSGQYTFEVTDLCGTRSIAIQVDALNCGCEIYVPNCFTPDNDGVNDVFFPAISCDLSMYDLRLFNSWGEEIFRSNDPTQKWTGNSTDKGNYYAQDGVYNYILQVQYDSTSFFSEVITRKGNVVLIR